MRYAGIDLAGSPRNPSGVAVIEHSRGLRIVFIGLLYSDEDILGLVERLKPVVAAVDAPLTPGRGYRSVDLELIKRGYRVLPPGWRGMRMLYERAVRLAGIMRGMGVEVVETHPRSALKSSGCSDVYRLAEAVGITVNTVLSRDEEDALVASIVALKHGEGGVLVFKACDGEVFLLRRLCD